jgi:glycosyltransferase involved in cell wall biosynthesis
MAMSDFQPSVSVIVQHAADLPHDHADFQALLTSLRNQDLRPTQIIIADRRGAGAGCDFLPPDLPTDAITHVPGDFANRAASLSAALEKVTSDFVLLVQNDLGAITLRQSALKTFAMAALRDEPVSLVYSDYERTDADGNASDVHLLDWHPGRLRDSFDLGPIWFMNTDALRKAGGFDATYNAADYYDLRLRMSIQGRVVHLANRYAGSLCTLKAAGAGHNVFAYLLADKQTQLELEQACTEHLKRINAYLAPGAFAHPVEANPAGHAKDCIASVVTPVNNRPEFIGRAIESVQSQTVQQVEMIVVVNGGHDDPTIPEVRRYMPEGDRYDAAKPAVRLIVVDINNLGLCLNSGLAQANGKYYVQLDSDDRLKPDAVEKIVAVFDSDPTIGMVVGSYEVWTLDEKSGQLHRNEEIPVVTHDEWTADNGRNNLLRINGAGAPRAANIQAVAQVGWFGVNDTPQCRNYGEDYDLVLRVSERYVIGRVWDPIYEVIRHSGGTDHSINQVTIDRNDNAKDAMRLEALQRRQRLNGAP